MYYRNKNIKLFYIFFLYFFLFLHKNLKKYENKKPQNPQKTQNPQFLFLFVILVLCKKNSKNKFYAFEVKKKPQKNLNFFYSKIQYLREKYYNII
jgi:hypothetical protein